MLTVTMQRERKTIVVVMNHRDLYPNVLTWQLFGAPHFFHPSWALPQNCFPSGSLCLFYWAFGEFRKGEINSVVMLMENHMLPKTVYVLGLKCKRRNAKINACQLPSLPRSENSKSLCSDAKNMACLKFHRLFKLKAESSFKDC